MAARCTRDATRDLRASVLVRGALRHGFGLRRCGAASLEALKCYAHFATKVCARHGEINQHTQPYERGRDNGAHLIAAAQALASSVKKLPMRRNFQ